MENEREIIICLFQDIVDDWEIAERLEDGCFWFAFKKSQTEGWSTSGEEFVFLYQSICFRSLVNLDPSSSINNNIPPEMQFINRLRSGLIVPEYVGSMTEAEMNPEINASIRSYLDQRREQKIDIKISNMNICKNCHKNETRMHKNQTRSGDEGVTWFITCIHCHHKWSERS